MLGAVVMAQILVALHAVLTTKGAEYSSPVSISSKDRQSFLSSPLQGRVWKTVYMPMPPSDQNIINLTIKLMPSHNTTF